MKAPMQFDVMVGSWHLNNADDTPGNNPVEVAVAQYFEYQLHFPKTKCVASRKPDEVSVMVDGGKIVYRMDEAGIRLNRQFAEAVTQGLRDMIGAQTVTLTYQG